MTMSDPKLAKELDPLGDLKLKNSISEEALTIFEEQPQSQVRIEELIIRSQALRLRGSVRLEEAWHKEAESAFLQAEQAIERALKVDPESTDAMFERNMVAFWLGFLHFKQRQWDDARKYFLVYLRGSEELVRLDAGNMEWRMELGYALGNLGTVAKKSGDLEQAIEYFKRSVALKERSHRENPSDSALEYELIDSLSWVSSTQYENGDLSEASAGYATQIAMLRRWIQKNPGNRAWERRLANFLKIAAGAQIDLGRLEEAMRMIDESTSLLSKSVQLDADNRVWRRDLAHALTVSADVSRFSGMEAHSIAKLRSARKLMIGLIASTEAQPDWRRLDATIRTRIAAHELAIEPMDVAITDLFRLLNGPDDVDARTALARAIVLRGKVRLRLGDNKAAIKDGAVATKILAPIAQGSRNINILALWVSAHALTQNLDTVKPQTDMLYRIGYRHPDIIDKITQL